MAIESMRQLPLPGVLVLVSTPSSGAIVADNVGWQRAVAQAGLAPAAKLVALILASHVEPASGADPELPAGSAVCAPGLRVLVAQTKYSRTHVQRQLALLRKLGWLTAVGRPAAGRPAQFVLTLPEDVARSAGVALARPAAEAAAAATDAAASASAAAAAAGRARGRLAVAGTAGAPADAARQAAAASQETPETSPMPAAEDDADAAEEIDDVRRTAAAGASGATAGGHRRRRTGGRTRATRTAPVERGRARIAGTLMRLGARSNAGGAYAEFAGDADGLTPRFTADPYNLLRGDHDRRPGPSWTPLEAPPVGRAAHWSPSSPSASPPSASPPSASTRMSGGGVGSSTGDTTVPVGSGAAAQDSAAQDPAAQDSAAQDPASESRPLPTEGGTGSAAHEDVSSRMAVGGVPSRDAGQVVMSPSADAETIDGASADRPAHVEPPSDPVGPVSPLPRDPTVEAATQVAGTLARAMRCEPAVFSESVDQLTAILHEGGWSAPMLATHLVHLVAGGVRVGSDSPADGLAWRLKHLPKTSAECPCGACRSWRAITSESRETPESARSGTDGTSQALPDLAEIERAGAVGAEQAALLARARAS